MNILEPSTLAHVTACIVTVSAFKVLLNATTLVGGNKCLFLDDYCVGEIPF
jgi:hypothetical protein